MATTIEKLCELCGVNQSELSSKILTLLIAEDLITNAYVIRVWDDGSSDELDCEEDDDFAAIARDHMEQGSWEGPARISYDWEVTDLAGIVIDDGSDELVIPADHATLIHSAMGDDGCGDDPEDHDWTSEGEGGCDENPGVWSTGGTSMVFQSHCRDCGLRRVERHTGSQSNPGECDTVEYSAPDEDE